VNFNLERLARGAQASSDSSLLGRAYAVMYGWQDRLVERFVDWRSAGASAYHDTFTVATLAQLGMSTQLALFGACIAFDRPLAAALLPVAQLAFVALLFVRRETLTQNREVSLEHR
jgi:hypothetical protein